MRSLIRLFLLASLMLACLPALTLASDGITYQGHLTQDGEVPSDGNYLFHFELYDALENGSSLWSQEDSLLVTQGVVNTVFENFTPDFFTQHPEVYLAVTLNGDLLTPRTRLEAVPYAFEAGHAALADSCINCGNGSGEDGFWSATGDDIHNTNTGSVIIDSPSAQPKLELKGDGAILRHTNEGNTLYEVGTNNGQPLLRMNRSDGTAVFRVDGDNGRVGIGIDIPASPLHVVGDIYSQSGRVRAEGMPIGTNKLQSFRDDGSSSIGTWTDPANPASKFAVFNGDDGLYLTTDWGDNNHFVAYSNMAGVGLGVDAELKPEVPAVTLALRQPNTGFHYAGSGTIAYMANSVERLRFSNNGNMGVGTTSPAYPLDVNGVIRSSSGGFRFPDGSMQITAAGSGLWSANGDNIYYNNGNVGIGTSSPGAKLAINSTWPHLRVSNGSSHWEIGDNVGTFYFRESGTSSGQFRIRRNDNTDMFVVDVPSANVGIGTTTPSSRLYVAGSSSSNPVLRVEQNSTHEGILATSNSVQTVKGAVHGKITATSGGGSGVFGETASPGVEGGAAVGVYGLCTHNEKSVGGATLGVLGRVAGYQEPNTGTSVPVGVFGEATHTTGIAWGMAGETYSTNNRACGVKGTLRIANSTGRAVWGDASNSFNTGYAGYFDGRVHVTGTITKGGGAFKIDHPLDPQNKYLYHSFVESPEMTNLYNGTATLDADGTAWVQMPEWFEALNRDFSYQLTAIGQPAPSLYVADEISGNRFKIAGGNSGQRVSWQVTGIRHDPYAEKYRIPLEEDKPGPERGQYLHPDAYKTADSR
ncbi:MAG: hypothetical protein Q8Q20_01925 [bacterium]|nr:hypothetical protein [bacterium]